MARRRKRVEKELPDPLAVLEERAKVRVEDLFDLIHRVNPTGRPLAAKEKARRYQLKNRLQSLLIRRFGDQHLVVARKEGDVVSLNHHTGLRDACHAVLSDLDPDARSWVLHQFDLASSPPAPEEPLRERPGDWNDGDLDPTRLVASGRQAIQAYDYEEAERRLTTALDLTGGGAEAALPLLELFVDHLGMDREALEIERRTSASARQQPMVRALLALAAARTGDGERAYELVRGVEVARTAEVYAAMADQAVRDSDQQVASRYLEAASERDPSHPRIQQLSDEIEALRAADRRPAEEELLARYRRRGALAAEEEARELARRWPQSEPAQRVLREAAEHRRQEQVAGLLERGEAAFAERRYGAAAGLLRKAIEAGGARPDLSERLAEAERRHRERQESEQVAAVEKQLASAVGKPALLAYLALTPSLRERGWPRTASSAAPGCAMPGGCRSPAETCPSADSCAPPPSLPPPSLPGAGGW